MVTARVGPLRRKTWSRFIVALVLVTFGLGAVGVQSASAHAVLIASSPSNDQLVTTPPTQVRLTFSESVETGVDAVQVISPSGAQVADASGIAGAAGLTVTVPITVSEKGTYTVVYRIVSTDGHPIASSFIFHYGVRSGAGVGAIELGKTGSSDRVVALLGWVGRLTAYAGLLVAAGALTSALLMSSGAVDSGANAERITGRNGLIPLAVVSALMGSLLIFGTRAMSVSGRSVAATLGDLGSIVSSSRTLSVDVARCVFVLVAVLAGQWGQRRGASRWSNGVALTSCVASLATFALGGHAFTSSPAALAVFADVLHLVAAAGWLGGLWVLLITLRAGDSSDQRIAEGFSRAAVILLPVVVVTGLVGTWLHVDTWGQLVSTNYGRLILAKVFAVAFIVGLGWMNRRLLATKSLDMVRLIASVTMERDIALAVIAITAVLVFVVPATNNSSGNIASRAASSTGSNTVDVTKTTPTGTVRLVLEPVEVGDNSIDLYFATTSGSVRQVDAVVVTISSAQVPARKIAVDLGVGSIVRANPVSFAVRGRWKITVKYATQGVAEVVNFEVEIQ